MIRGKFADGLYNSMINDQDGHIPWPRLMFTCTAVRHPSLEWQKNKGVHLRGSNSKLKADRPDHSNYFNYIKDDGMNASCCAATGHKLLTSPGVADMYTVLMNTWTTLPESYRQRVYKNTLATVKGQIRQAENPTPAVVINTEAVRVDNAILLDYLNSEMAIEESEIGSTDPKIPTDNNCTDDKLDFGMAGGSGDYEHEGDESHERDDLPTTSRRRRPATGLHRSSLGTRDVDGYEGEDGDDVDVDAHEEEEASQANDGSTQNVEDWGLSKFDLWTSHVDRYECEDGDDVDTDKEEEASQDDDGSTQNVEDWWHSGFHLWTGDVDGYECEDGDDADTDKEEEALPADDGSMQNVEDWGHSTRECDDWTVYFRHVKYDNGEANATASNVSEAKTVLQ